MRLLFLAVLAVPVASAAAQAPPPTDVYLASIKLGRGTPVIGAPSNLTHRAGFDNQPYFTPDGRAVLYSSYRPGGPNGTGQSDIFMVDLASGRSTPIIETPESEYSATPIPGGREIAVIRVERDSTQRLWAFPLKPGASQPRLLLERVKPVGYQAWLDERTVGVFVLGAPPTLQVADLVTGDARILLPSIGRALRQVPGKRALSVNQQISDSTWWIMEVDPVSAKATPLARMLPGSDFYIWLTDGSLLSSLGNALYHRRSGAGSDWVKVKTFDGMKSITRLALSPRGDRLAFVAEDGAP